MEYGKTRKNNSVIIHKTIPELKKYNAETFSETTGIEIQSQYWGGNRQLFMEGIAVEYFTNLVDPGSNVKIRVSFIYKL